MLPNTKFYEVCIKEFAVAFEQPMYKHVDDAPCAIHTLRANLIWEELSEYYSAPSPIEELDALCDLHYVVIGTNISYSVPVKPYVSGQLRMHKLPKQTINARPVLNDLQSLFPCQNLMFAELNNLIARIEDVAYMSGYNIRGAFQAVHENNMAKLWPEEPNDKDLTATKKNGGWLVRRADGKVIKPPGHTKVDLSPYL